MTLVESTRNADPAVASEQEAPARVTRRTLRDAKRPILSTGLIALVVVVLGWAVFALLQGPVAQAWNHTRQHQLAAQLSASRPHTGRGAAIAVFQVPRLGINQVVAEGDSPQQLRSGPGHRMGTPLPGDVGNSVVVAHRNGWGGAFKAVGEMKTGDLVVVQTQDAAQGPRNAVFKVISVQRVDAGDLAPFSGSTDRRLTLVTGAGGQFSDARLVVVAVSGQVGKIKPPADGVEPSTPAGSRLWNGEMLFALVGLGGALLVGLAIRRRYRPAVVLAAIAPLVTLGVLALCLNLDLFLPPLR